MSAVCVSVRTGDEDIVDVGEAEGQFLQHFIHDPQEGLGRAQGTKDQSNVLIQARRCYKGCVQGVRWVDWNLMEGFDDAGSGDVGARGL